MQESDAVEQRISIVTLGVTDLERARAFYAQLGWRGQEVQETVFFQAGGMALVLWGRDKLAQDSGLEDVGPGGFAGVTLAQNVRSRAEVDEIIAREGRRDDLPTAGRDLLRRLRRSLRRPGRSTRGRSHTTPASRWPITGP